ncbi:glycosyltransferase family 4 protein [Synechocystis sp. FACHB-383]|uniref:glycosyltransferase family 4 protein n=1 Tax=Synechocystis sp. FACHB-383 TaxID=2692864 RepID=UPI001689F64D|nr:glycosyltransferase family 4 protein [Synechocystis sp. FACHB-383]MBD2654448.1 glycosyltransferase family 4 protein [Synechocystis sp. FACHB-383]
MSLALENHKKKLSVLFTNYGPYHIARINASKSLFKKNWQVIGLEITRDGVDYQWKIKLDEAKFEIISILGDSKINQIGLTEQACSTFFTLNKLNPSVIVIAGYERPIMLLALFWAIFRHRPRVMLSESKEDDQKRIWWKEKIKSLLIKKYSSALVGGNSHKKYLVKLGFPENAIFTGYDVVDNRVFHPDVIRHLPNPLTEPFFLSINRFVKKKNLPLLISAYASYIKKQSGNAWHLVLCGNGELRSELEEQISQHNLQKFVHLPGFLQQDELLPYFAHAQCFVHASTTEQWGLVVNEAMAAGLPVLISNRCGCFEDLIIEGVNGFGFDPENQDQLTKLMLKISSGEVDLDLMGQASLEHIQKYSPDYFAQGLQQAVEFAINKKTDQQT